MGVANERDAWLWPIGEEVPLLRDAIEVQVCHYDPEDTESPFTHLTNVVCVSIAEEIGTNPGTARLRYRFDNYRTDPAAPADFVEALSDTIYKAKIVEPNERIVVRARQPGSERWIPIFDGLVKAFEMNVSGQPPREDVSILCVGIASRCFDIPVGGALVRSSALPKNPTKDVLTELVARFNPKGKGNACPDDDWHDDGDGKKYPTFLDEENEHATKFHLHGAARYVLLTANGAELHAKNPDLAELDNVLKAKVPIPGVKFDPEDPATYTREPIVAPDGPITGKAWPNVLQQLVSSKGFGMHWDLSAGGEDDHDPEPPPETRLAVYDPQQSNKKTLMLQPKGATLDPALTNVGAAAAARDLQECATEWHVEGELEEYEVSLVLACAWPTPLPDQPAEPTFAFLKTLLKSAPGYTGPLHDAFRTWIYDESGEGHYEPGENVPITDPGSLDEVLGKPITVNDQPQPQYATRRRPPIAELITKAGGKPLKASLSISTDYEGPCPAVWNGYGTDAITEPGTWQPVLHGWELLKDRLGVHVTAEDPNQWDIGRSDVAGHPFRMGVVRAVESLAYPSGTMPKFFLRLTCKLRGDRRLKGIAAHKLDGPVDYAIIRTVDAHDRYKRQIVKGGSEHRYDVEVPELADDDIARDDEPAAKAEATAVQIATLGGIMGGTITIPRFTRYYQLGDRIRGIEGRGLGFDTKAAGTQSEPTYPVVVGRQHVFEPKQITKLLLSDANMARHSYTARVRRRRDKSNG